MYLGATLDWIHSAHITHASKCNPTISVHCNLTDSLAMKVFSRSRDSAFLSNIHKHRIPITWTTSARCTLVDWVVRVTVSSTPCPPKAAAPNSCDRKWLSTCSALPKNNRGVASGWHAGFKGKPSQTALIAGSRPSVNIPLPATSGRTSVSNPAHFPAMDLHVAATAMSVSLAPVPCGSSL
jgi:hypothetical protein